MRLLHAFAAAYIYLNPAAGLTNLFRKPNYNFIAKHDFMNTYFQPSIEMILNIQTVFMISIYFKLIPQAIEILNLKECHENVTNF